jgi:type IV pilus assembly protein PilY1
MSRKSFIATLAAAAMALPLAAQAQTVSENFTGASTANSWWFFNGACLTAGTLAGSEPSGGNAGQVPGCTTIASSYYNKTVGEVLVGGYNGTFPDPVGNGALRFTNGFPYGYSENGGIVSTTPFPTGQGVSITFKTVTYRGNSGGAGADGADGISFYLMDASQLNTSTITGVAAGDGNGLGSWGGSLGYTCSNANPPYNGLIGGYVAVGIDEYGNFLNGQTLMPGYTGPNQATGDNTALGYGYKPGRIGMRGAGTIAWNWLTANYPAYYPSTFSAAQQQSAVQNTCRNGVVWNSTTNSAALSAGGAQMPLADYAPIPGAYVELPAGTQIASEAALTRGAATTILYKLKLTEDDLLSLSYSINGGAYQAVITGQSIAASNGPLPANFLFGFAGSTGGSTNIHEILCFQAEPATTADTSAGASEKQSAKLETGVQAYFAYYNPNTWAGRVTAAGLSFDQYGNVTIAATPNWDAACDLNGVGTNSTCPTTGVAGPTAAEAPASRVILSWNGASGIKFEWGSLTAAQQTALDAGGISTSHCNASTGYAVTDRLSYLRGDRSCEVNSAGVGLYRARAQILGDIVDSSPQWVGPPIASFPPVWTDRLYSSTAMPENAGQTYPQYITAEQTRLNVVYVGSDDGLLHGFRTGSFDMNGNFISTYNDGEEVLAYMPGAVVQTIHSSTTPTVDFSNTQYGHAFFVDATPGTGDVFYQGQWHSWIMGGLGPGGAAIYALDVSNPTTANFTEANAASLVIGEWTPATISCSTPGGGGCGTNLGNTYGTPQLRRLHDGKWGMIFGNGYGSTSGDAGIFVMTIDPTTAAKTFYYLSTHTGSAAKPNGIAYATPADLDGDHVADYVYAGDLQGNVWRFDLTSNSEANWAVTPGPLFTTQAGQPITTEVVVAGGSPSPGMEQQVMVLFGTGQKFPLTNSSSTSYATGTQSLYGVWDWNLKAWDSISAAQYASLTAAATGLTSTNQTMTAANLQLQNVTIDPTSSDRQITTNATICWAGQPSCGGAAAQFGWYLNLPGSQEQIIYGPELLAQALTVNSIVPAVNSLIACTNLSDTGYTYVLNALTGGAFNSVFYPPSEASNPAVANNPAYTDQYAIGMQTNATGSSLIVLNNAGGRSLVFETNQVQGAGAAGNSIANGSLLTNLPPNTTGRRLSWVERR